MTRPQGFTPEEEKVYDDLVAAYNGFLHLPRLHPRDVKDFGTYMTILQNIMLSRVACRALGWSYDESGARIENENLP